jgi:hypothetical protein
VEDYIAGKDGDPVCCVVGGEGRERECEEGVGGGGGG